MGDRQSRRKAVAGVKKPALKKNVLGRSTGRPAPPWALAIGLLVLFAALLAVRLPFVSNPLVGEETHFAFMAVANGHDALDPNQHNFLYLGRVGGKMAYGPAEHPVPSYLFITHVLRGFSNGSGFDRLTFDQKSRTARVRFLVCFCVGLILLLAIAWDTLRGADHLTALLGGALIAFALSMPLMVGASVQPQMDGSLGVMWIALATGSLYLASKRLPLAGMVMLAATGGFFACMGKNEWAMAMFGAAVAAWVMVLAARRFLRPPVDFPDYRHTVLLLGGIIGGVLMGSLVSCLLDPWNYFHGLDVMRRTQQVGVISWSATFLERVTWIWPVFVLLGTALAAALAGWRRLLARQIGYVVILTWSLALFAGFLISKWPGDHFPRYFCTSLFGLLCFLTIFLPRLPLAAWLKAAAVALLLLGVAFNLTRLAEFQEKRLALGSSPGTSLVEQAAMLKRTQASAEAAGGQLLVTDLTFGYYYPTLNFISNTVPQEQWPALFGK